MYCDIARLGSTAYAVPQNAATSATTAQRCGTRRSTRRSREVLKLLNDHLDLMLQRAAFVVENVEDHVDRLTAGRWDPGGEDVGANHIRLIARRRPTNGPERHPSRFPIECVSKG